MSAIGANPPPQTQMDMKLLGEICTCRSMSSLDRGSQAEMGVSIRSDRFTSIRDVAQTSQMRK